MIQLAYPIQYLRHKKQWILNYQTWRQTTQSFMVMYFFPVFLGQCIFDIGIFPPFIANQHKLQICSHSQWNITMCHHFIQYATWTHEEVSYRSDLLKVKILCWATAVALTSSPETANSGVSNLRVDTITCNVIFIVCSGTRNMHVVIMYSDMSPDSHFWSRASHTLWEKLMRAGQLQQLLNNDIGMIVVNAIEMWRNSLSLHIFHLVEERRKKKMRRRRQMKKKMYTSKVNVQGWQTTEL